MKHGAPDVSVILPCHDAEDTVGATLRSVLRQSLPKVEVIAVDDGSRDRTGAILARFADRHPDRVRRLHHPRAEGPYVARNRAAAVARGRYLAFLDADDTWLPRKLERQVALMEHRPGVVLCHTAITVVNPRAGSSLVKSPGPDFDGSCFRRLLVSNGVNTSSVLVRAEDFRSSGGFDEAFEARGDWEMWIRLARTGAFALIDAPLTRILNHPGRMSFDTERMRRHHLAIIAKSAELYEDAVPDLPRRLREARIRAHLLYAADHLRADRTGPAIGEVMHGIRLSPGDLRPWKGAVRCLLYMARALLIRCGVPGTDGPGRTPSARGSRPHVS